MIHLFGETIADSPVATAVYSRLWEVGVDIHLNFHSRPMYNGYKVVGEYSPGSRVPSPRRSTR